MGLQQPLQNYGLRPQVGTIRPNRTYTPTRHEILTPETQTCNHIAPLRRKQETMANFVCFVIVIYKACCVRLRPRRSCRKFGAPSHTQCASCFLLAKPVRR